MNFTIVGVPDVLLEESDDKDQEVKTIKKQAEAFVVEFDTNDHVKHFDLAKQNKQRRSKKDRDKSKDLSAQKN